MRLLVAVCLVAGCDQILGLHEVDPPPLVPDAPPPACLGEHGLFQNLCSPTDLIAQVELAETIDTDRCLAQTGGVQSTMPPACIVWGARIHGSNVTASGSVPLVLAATQLVAIDGVLDVGAHAGATPNAPAAAGCTIAATNGIKGAADDGGGGGGGGYQGGGGNGGIAADGGNPGKGAAATPLGLRGGCDGGKGGPSATTSGAVGGGGGGAIYILTTKLVLGGAIVAGGGGGGGDGTHTGGGGGGGGGGLVALDSVSIEIDPSARLCANGGGGGGGGTAASPGLAGVDGCVTNEAASGGVADVNAGTGGNGAAGSDHDGAAGVDATLGVGGAGGGGGGAGHIVFYDDHPNATASPPAD